MKAAELTPRAFAPYGEVIEVTGEPTAVINAGLCERFSDLASFDIKDGALGLSLFQSQLRAMPFACDLLERHPLGSQCFVPMSGRYLVIVADDVGGVPGEARVFHARETQAINIARNTWHGVLAPTSGSGLFAVMDRIGTGPNLEEHRLQSPLMIEW